MTALETGLTATQENQGLIPQDQQAIQQINQGIRDNTLQSDIRFSRLAILQPNSPEIAGQTPGYQAGMLIDNLTREVLTDFVVPPWLTGKVQQGTPLTPVHCMPFLFVYKLPTEYIKWIKKEERKDGGDRWEFKTLDIKHPGVQQGIWRSKGGTFQGKKPPVTDNTNFLILPLDMEQHAPKGYFRVASFSRTSSACGQTAAGHLNGLAIQHALPWSKVFYLYTKREQRDGNTYYVMQLAPGPRVTPELIEPFVGDMCMDMGKALTHKDTGKTFQEILINAAAFDEDDGSHEEADGGGDATGTNDPFAEPKF